MKYLRIALPLILLIMAASAQDIQVNQQNKTIAVTAEESISADAEVATLSIGYHDYGDTQDAAFQENVRTSGQITKAFLQSGVPKVNIETEKLLLRGAELDEKWTSEMKKARQFEARQSWEITVPVSQAQRIVDLAVQSGANEVDDVEWNVIDPIALQAKAGGAALAKARAVADQMAKGLGAKLGELIYASNHVPLPKVWRHMATQTVQAETSSIVQPADKKPELTLFPEKVKSDATVYAVFAIE